MKPIKNPDVLTIYESYEEKYRTPLLKIRELIYDTAEKMYGSESITEELKWNQPSYATKHGSPIRLDIFGWRCVFYLLHIVGVDDDGLAQLAEGNDRRLQRAHLRGIDANQAAAKVQVLPAGEVGVETSPQFQDGRHAAMPCQGAAGRLQRARQ